MTGRALSIIRTSVLVGGYTWRCSGDYVVLGAEPWSLPSSSTLGISLAPRSIQEDEGLVHCYSFAGEQGEQCRGGRGGHRGWDEGSSLGWEGLLGLAAFSALLPTLIHSFPDRAGAPTRAISEEGGGGDPLP